MFSCLLIYYIDKKKQKTKARNRISLWEGYFSKGGELKIELALFLAKTWLQLGLSLFNRNSRLPIFTYLHRARCTLCFPYKTDSLSFCQSILISLSVRCHFYLYLSLSVFLFLLKMSLLSDLINLSLSETTEKVIAEYIWWAFSDLHVSFLNTIFYLLLLLHFIQCKRKITRNSVFFVDASLLCFWVYLIFEILSTIHYLILYLTLFVIAWFFFLLFQMETILLQLSLSLSLFFFSGIEIDFCTWVLINEQDRWIWYGH